MKEKILTICGIWIAMGSMWYMGYLTGKWSEEADIYKLTR